MLNTHTAEPEHTQISPSRGGDGACVPPVSGGMRVAGPGAAPPNAERAAGSTQPPFANRGVDTGRYGNWLGISTKQILDSEGFDWLTVTVPDSMSARMQAATEFGEEGFGRPGFGSSEQRLMFGGKCWRRFDPRGESRDFGLQYESWEFSGSVAHTAAVHLVPDGPCRATRVDWRVDLEVDKAVMSDDVVEAMREHTTDHRITTGVSGHAGVNTRYVGSRKSDRMVRVYRKDLQDQSLIYEGRSVMRIELVLRHDLAADAFALYRSDERAGAAAFREHMRQLTGLRLGELGELPPPAPRLVDDEVASQYFKFMQMHGDQIEVFRRLGLDVSEDARERWNIGKPSRVRESRLRRRMEDAASVDAEAVRTTVRRAWVAGIASPD